MKDRITKVRIKWSCIRILAQVLSVGLYTLNLFLIFLNSKMGKILALVIYYHNECPYPNLKQKTHISYRSCGATNLGVPPLRPQLRNSEVVVKMSAGPGSPLEVPSSGGRDAVPHCVGQRGPPRPPTATPPPPPPFPVPG